MNKTLVILLLLLPVGLVGCGENNNPANNSAKNPVKGLTIENVSGTYERVDGLDFKLVIEKSGTFKDYFQHLFEDISGATFAEQASGNCKIVEKEVHFHYQTPADLAESGRVQIFRVQQDGSLALIAVILNGKRHDLTTEQQAETVDWIKRSDSVATTGFRIVKLKPRPARSKEQDEELSDILDAFPSADPTSAPESDSSSVAPLSPQAKAHIKATWSRIDNLESALAFYYFDMQAFPSTADGLAALLKPPADKNKARKWDGPYLKDEIIPADAWDNTFVYEYDLPRRQDFPHISSLGSDGLAKTEDDIVNWGAAATKRRAAEEEMMEADTISDSSLSPQPATEAIPPKKETLVWVSDPGNPQNVLVEQRIRRELRKPTGELTEADLEKVEDLSLILSKITDEGLQEVAKLKRLRSLRLIKTNISDMGLRQVAKLPKLRRLWIDATKITDAGLKEVAKLQQLGDLGLSTTQVTDAGLKELAKLKNLYEVNLRGTKVTKAGVAALQKVLPDCRILH